MSISTGRNSGPSRPLRIWKSIDVFPLRRSPQNTSTTPGALARELLPARTESRPRGRRTCRGFESVADDVGVGDRREGRPPGWLARRCPLAHVVADDAAGPRAARQPPQQVPRAARRALAPGLLAGTRKLQQTASDGPTREIAWRAQVDIPPLPSRRRTCLRTTSASDGGRRCVIAPVPAPGPS